MKAFHFLKGALVLSTLSLLAGSSFAQTIMGIGGIAKTPIQNIRGSLNEGASLQQVAQQAAAMGFDLTVR